MLIQAAQHLDKHPGPLGHFFRKIMKKKCRNVAVVSGARKLAVIGWMMLNSNDTYRYSIPKTTEAKLAKLRVKATGQKRKGGAGKGVKAVAKLAGGSRTIKSLTQVCTLEGLPEPRPLSSGEQRTVKAADCQVFVAQIAASQIVPRPKGGGRPRSRKPSAEMTSASLKTRQRDALATACNTGSSSLSASSVIVEANHGD
jgi:hypothetical protein